MDAEVACGGCGQRFAAAPHLWGTQVACPSCQATIDVPDFETRQISRDAAQAVQQPAAAESVFAPIEVHCGGCRQRFAAPPSLAGETVACPSCQNAITVPLKPPPVRHHQDRTEQPHDWFSEQVAHSQAAPVVGFINTDGTLGPVPAMAKRPALQSDRYIDEQANRRQQRTIALVVGGIVLLAALPFLLYGIVLASGYFFTNYVTYSSTPFDVASVPPPPLPTRPAFMQLEPGVLIARPSTGVPRGKPGGRSRLYIYLPEGRHAAESLGCVFIAPAGATVLTGMELGSGDQPEHLPYVRAGYAVVAYEVDGYPGPLENVTDEQFGNAYLKYRDSMAGLVNARNAIDFALATLPEVNPNRLYAAGHSSAGKQALLLAEHEPRLAGCLAYAPVSDVVSNSREQSAALLYVAPGCGAFLKKSSPRTHEASLNCPIFLFHATGDDVIPFAESEAFAARLQSQGKQVEFSVFEGGDHYSPMISAGIPRGINWLQSLPR